MFLKVNKCSGSENLLYSTLPNPHRPHQQHAVGGCLLSATRPCISAGGICIMRLSHTFLLSPHPTVDAHRQQKHASEHLLRHSLIPNASTSSRELWPAVAHFSSLQCVLYARLLWRVIVNLNCFTNANTGCMFGKLFECVTVLLSVTGNAASYWKHDVMYSVCVCVTSVGPQLKDTSPAVLGYIYLLCWFLGTAMIQMTGDP